MKLEEIKKFVAELRGLSQEELAQTARLNEVKKQIARVKTVQSEIK